MEDETVFTKIQRSWQLIKASAGVVRDDPVLLAFPVMTAVVAVPVILSFLLPLPVVLGREDLAGDDLSLLVYVWLFVLYAVLYAVGIFFNTALAAVALARMDGSNAGVREGLALASRRLPGIVGYALIAATVGLILRAIEDRVGVVGRIVTGLLGVAWSVSTFLVVPVLAVRGVSPVEALIESARLLKSTWGENVIGTAGLATVFGLGYFALGIAAGIGFALLGAAWGTGLSIVLAAIGLFGVVLQSTLQAVYSAALYRHAAGEDGDGPFPARLLRDAFVARRR
jgi:hypothetical protein